MTFQKMLKQLCYFTTFLESVEKNNVFIAFSGMKDHNNRSPPLTFRTYQILPHTNSYFRRLRGYLDLLLPGAPGAPRVGKAPLVP